MDTLIGLLDYGQSYWLDNLTRKKITSGELKKRVSGEGLRGITSNPSIFNKAISNSTDYDEQISSLVKEGKTVAQIYDALTIKDVQEACDILKTVYDQSAGTDGFVSLEVLPYLAHDTEGTMKEARRLSNLVGRQNCLIKIPGTHEGIQAIEQMLYEGININVTLLFSVKRYIEVANAHIRAIVRKITEGKPINNIISVASVFISRIDILTDQLLGQRIVQFKDGDANCGPESLLGKAGTATAQLVYQQFKELFNSKNWDELEEKGAKMQRPLWASTSNKDPMYNDLRYVESLIGKNTINTLPDETITALAQHGDLKSDTIEKGLVEATQLFTELDALGINIDFITQQLENEGIQKFTDAYNELIKNLASKRLKILGNQASQQMISYGKLEAEINSGYNSVDEKQIGRLLFAKDPYLWKAGIEQVKEISHRLGWLSLPDNFVENAESLIKFSEEIKNEGYTDAVLLGMGGSSLCSEVARETFGTKNGYLKLSVLDNTAPAAILELENKIDINKTLFIVASKSGNTEETLSFFRYFYEQLEKTGKHRPGNSFVAITDDGTPLVKIAEENSFRKIFLNSPDLGGRYSVLSDFGLVPMALMGIDINALLSSAKQMESSCDSVPASANPGISLGIVLGVCQKRGRNKVTFVLSSSISSFGLWAEQLLAESTGKEGRGLIPINGELLGVPSVYRNDRVFVHMYLPTDNNYADEKKLKALEAAGHPVIRICLTNEIALGGEYYRWEIAAAIAGIVMGINSFDQPNVEESKKNTNQLLEEWKKEGSFKTAIPLLKTEAISIYGGKAIEKFAIDQYESMGDFVRDFTEQAREGDYIALLPYFLMTGHRTKILQAWRQQMRDELKVATTMLNGPRYLHSTGQLHKGGPDTGLYILLIGDEEEVLSIPEEKFGFETLHQAQALGDFRSLNDKGRRVIRINLGCDIDSGLNKLYRSIKGANRLKVSHQLI
ncbi:MAG TPA: bifunctional transaldolase/phosoglucose isomerase [Bacteroidia bacterium]|jgi:transaldolase/glucose-6-phosphate isomerase|nr:bifunctional transaldolase/phosoglucose isomerase [Bacteroidia bacterium]